MIALRRLTALVTMLVTLVLVLAESGFACSERAMEGMAGMPMAGMPMADMPMADMPMADMPMADMPMTESPGDAGHGPAPERAPCRFPWAPSGCRDMAPCAPAAMTAVAEVLDERAPSPHMVVVTRVSAPASFDTPPELPPPRA